MAAFVETVVGTILLLGGIGLHVLGNRWRGPSARRRAVAISVFTVGGLLMTLSILQSP